MRLDLRPNGSYINSLTATTLAAGISSPSLLTGTSSGSFSRAFNKDYLDYMRDPESQTFPPDRPPIENEMITFQRFGPFRLRVSLEMEMFVKVLLPIC